MEETLNKITDIINWYKNQPQHNNDIDGLLFNRKELSCEVFSYTSYAKEFKSNFDKYYYLRRVQFEKEKIRLLKESKGVSKAEAQALINIEETYKNEKSYESAYTSAKMIIQQANKVLDSMSQEISFLKKEKESTYQRN